MFKKKHKYQVVFADGKSVCLEGYGLSFWDDDKDETKGDVFISDSKRDNDVAWFRKETLKYIVKIG